MYTDRELYYSVTTHLVIEEGDHVREDDFFGWREGRGITNQTLMAAIAHSPLWGPKKVHSLPALYLRNAFFTEVSCKQRIEWIQNE